MFQFNLSDRTLWLNHTIWDLFFISFSEKIDSMVCLILEKKSGRKKEILILSAR